MQTRSKVKISESQYKEILENNRKNKKQQCKDLISQFKSSDVIRIIEKTHPWLNVKQSPFPGLKYDEIDKDYIKYAYGSLSNYDYDEDYSDSDEEEDTEDVKYFINLSQKEKEDLMSTIEKVKTYNQNDIPTRFKVLKSSMDISTKAIVLHKVDELDKMNEDSGEYHKLNHWIENLMRIPFNSVQNIECSRKNKPEEISDYLIKSKSILDSVVYGHQKAKSQIFVFIFMCKNS